MDVIEATEAFVKERLAGDATGHDWWHVHRVRQLALRLAQEEHADRFVVELAALLHDVDDWKLTGSTEPVQTRAWLASQGIHEDINDHVCEIIKTLSFKGAGVQTPMRTLEGACVQDADRLDAIGAVGVARTFAYGGSKGTPMHLPGVKPQLHDSFDAYKKANASVINHFHEKLLLLKDRMNTTTAKRIAQDRHKVMETFLAEFHAEWDGDR